MNKKIKTGVLVILLAAGISFSGFAVDLDDLQNAAADFSGELAKTLPFNAALGLNWSDAYIGKLIPGIPHFGAGASLGFTTMDLPPIEKLAGILGYNIPFDSGKMFLPAYAAEGRLGGLFLPFDAGVKVGYLPPVGIMGSNAEIDYLLVGGDIRYAVLDGSVFPKISVGVGVNYLRGGVTGSAGGSQTISFDTEHITLGSPEVNLKWETVALDFKVQVSKSFVIITPYLGIGASYAWSSAGYSVDAAVSGDIDDVKDYLAENNLDGMDAGGAGISSIIKNESFSARLFGGLSVDLAVFRIDLSGLYNFRDSNYGASLGFRFQP